MTTTIKTAASTKPIRVYSGEIQVGIWERCNWSVRMYEGKAIVRMPYVKWVNNSGSLDFTKERIEPGYRLTKLLALVADERSGKTTDSFGDNRDFGAEALEVVSQ
jgi:hypothetical protein